MIKRAIYIVENNDSPQFRYRVSNVKQMLKGDKDWVVDHCLSSEIKKKKEEYDDVVFFVVERQAAKNNDVVGFIDFAHKSGKKVLFDLDDLIFDYRDLLLLMKSTNSKNVVYWMGYFWGIRRIAKKVDGFIVTNDFLGRKVARTFKKPYKVIRNFLNKEQIKISEEIVKKKDNNKRFTIGYFSGSPTHTKDFRLVEPELMRFLGEHNDARVEVVGYMDFSNGLKRMIESGKVVVKKPVDYLKLQELMAEVSVNIAPLVKNDFTDCKSELKFFEAALVELPTIASPSFTFKKAIEDEKNGLLAEPGEWYSKLNNLYNDDEKVRVIAKQAKKDALQHYYGEEVLDEIKEAYDYFSN